MAGDRVIGRITVEHQNRCQAGFDAETKLYANDAPEGTVWRCGDCGSYYVRHPVHDRFITALEWVPATRKELRQIGREVSERREGQPNPTDSDNAQSDPSPIAPHGHAGSRPVWPESEHPERQSFNEDGGF